MNQQSLIAKFLLAPQYRAWRYLVLLVFFIIVSINQALVGYIEFIPQIGKNIYWIVAVTILVYLATVLWISKVVSTYLLSGKYFMFVIYILLCALLFTVISEIPIALYTSDYNFFSEAVIADCLSAFVVYVLCISGVVIPIFLRNWMVASWHLKELKLKKASSQVEQFKEQINPQSFFKVLSKSKCLVKTEPEKASAMLMKLAQLLRYQLYDCNRDRVLLTAEISFLRNFLELEKLNASNFDFTLELKGNINGVFIFPTILLPFVQSVINVLDIQKELCAMNVCLHHDDGETQVALDVMSVSNHKLLQQELAKVRERLDMWYKARYNLSVTNSLTTGNTEIVLTLEK